MKNYKYIGLFLLSIGFVSCDVNNELDEIAAEVVPTVELNTNGLDFSKYVSIGASFTSGYTDGALFIAAQESSFPNILAGKFSTDFTQPLMNDNIGGIVFGATVVQEPRLYFNGAGPARLPATPTTELTNVLSGPFNNMGIPGAKSFHLGVPGYGSLNPYFGRMASSPAATVMGDAIAQNPTFFTLSEIGGNDVLGYATSGGIGVDQSPTATNPTGNLDPATYGQNDITNPLVFGQVFNNMATALTANGAKGVVANVPYVTSLAYFTTVPYNPVPLDAATSGALNAQLLGPVIQILTALGEPDRMSLLEESSTNKLLIKDEDLVDFSAQISGALQGAGVPAAQAGLMGALYGQARHATADDLIVLVTSGVIGTTTATVPAPFNTQGVTYPLADQWVLTTVEQAKVKAATDAYNTTIEAVVAANSNLALVDFKGVLQEASTGIQFDEYVMNTSLVFGGLVSLDGVHLTGRGYALMANKILAAMDTEFGSNFTTATGGLAKAGDYTTNYSPTLQ
jgi:hypothetical protein